MELTDVKIFDEAVPLKMYRFNPNDWGMHWHVCAVSKEAAFDALIKHFKEAAEKEAADPHAAYYTQDRERYKRWKKCTIDKLPMGCTLEEYTEGGITGIETS